MIHSFFLYNYYILLLQNFKSCLVLLVIHFFLMDFLYFMLFMFTECQFHDCITSLHIILQKFSCYYNFFNVTARLIQNRLHILIPRSKITNLETIHYIKTINRKDVLSFFLRTKLYSFSHLRIYFSKIIWCLI